MQYRILRQNAARQFLAGCFSLDAEADHLAFGQLVPFRQTYEGCALVRPEVREGAFQFGIKRA